MFDNFSKIVASCFFSNTNQIKNEKNQSLLVAERLAWESLLVRLLLRQQEEKEEAVEMIRALYLCR